MNVDEFSEWNTRELARRRVTRRTALKAVAAGAGGIALSQFLLADSALEAGGGGRRTDGAAHQSHGRPLTAHEAVAISGRHLSYAAGGPANLGMAVTAQLVSASGSLPRGLRAFVDIGRAPHDYGTHVEADIVHLAGLYAIPHGPVASQYYAKAQLTKLRPHTVYHYRIRLSDGTTTGDAHFTTAPVHRLGAHAEVAAPFTFTATGDMGTANAPIDPRFAWANDPAVVRADDGRWPRGTFDNHDPRLLGAGALSPRALAAGIFGERPVFTLVAGDICYANPTGSGLPADNTGALTHQPTTGRNLFNPYVWDTFLTQIEPQAAFAPWLFATGNHDMEPIYGDTTFLGGGGGNHGYGGHVARLDMPQSGPSSCPSVYQFRYGNVGVISVDANELSYEIRTNTGYSNGAQRAWLQKTLAQWRDDAVLAPSIDFIVVFLHHCAYSTADTHGSDGGVRNTLDPLFSNYQVDLVIQGHNHVAERTDPIKFGQRTRAAPDGSVVHPAADGVTYLCVGSGGRARSPFRPAPNPSAPAAPSRKPKGALRLPEGQRYRGHRPGTGEQGGENTGEEIVNSRVFVDERRMAASGYPAGVAEPEAVDWSQTRFLGYAFIAVDVAPAPAGKSTTLTVRMLADLRHRPQPHFTEIDRVTLQRVAGANGQSAQ